jgi:hypothetical protein
LGKISGGIDKLIEEKGMLSQGFAYVLDWHIAL